MRWWQRLPFFAVAPVIQVPRPAEYGGLLTVFPLDNRRSHYALLAEVREDWAQTIAEGQNVGIPAYTGDVGSVQLTARPGFYVPPDFLYEVGWNGLPEAQEGPFS